MGKIKNSMYDSVCQQHMNSYATGLSQVYSRQQRPVACMCKYTRPFFFYDSFKNDMAGFHGVRDCY